MSRRLRQSSRTAEAEVNLTPMLDVVFILLIFFIVTAVFITEHAIGIEPPPQSANPTKPQPAIIVEIDADQLIRVNGRLSHIERVEANLQRVKTETSAQAVIIQAHPETPNRLVIRVRDQIASADMDQVNLVLSEV
jgi:biopolymer transport protein ExbD